MFMQSVAPFAVKGHTNAGTREAHGIYRFVTLKNNLFKLSPFSLDNELATRSRS